MSGIIAWRGILLTKFARSAADAIFGEAVLLWQLQEPLTTFMNSCEAVMVTGEPGAMLVAQRFADVAPIGLLFLSYGPDGRLRQTRVGWPE